MRKEQSFSASGLINSSNMLEGPFYIISKELPSARHQESEWVHSSCHVEKLVDGKRPLEDGREELELQKFPKLCDALKRRGRMLSLHDLSPAHAKQSDNQDQAENQCDSSSLISQLGRDNSINCLVRCSRSDYGSLAALNKDFRSLIRSGELYRLRRQMGIVEHWVYFSCDLFEWQAFDPIHLRWMHLPRMILNDCFMCSDKESLGVGTEVLVFGKEITSHAIYKYSILTNSWSSGVRMNTSRCLFGSASLGEIAILAGGCNAQGGILSTAELYNSETGVWEYLPSMNKPRKMCSGVFMDNKFYVVGGVEGQSKVLTCGEMYDLETKTWHVIPDMYPGRSGDPEHSRTFMGEAPPLIAVVNNELYLADYVVNEVRKYDKESNLWNTIGNLPERAVSMNGWGLAFRACGDKIVVIGGPRTMSGAGVIEVYSWTPAHGPPDWYLLASRRSNNFVYNCAVMGC